MEQPILMPYQDFSFNGDTHMNAEFLKLKQKWMPNSLMKL
jgi:hypothetical protein